MAITRLVLLLAIACGACGKKGPPLAPYQPDPQPVADFKVGQQGDRLLVSYTAPRQTVDAQPLDVHDVQILVAARPGDLARVARVHTVRVAPGEARTELLPLPEVDQTARIAARARNKGRRSGLSRTAALTVQTAPAGPDTVTAQTDPAGIIVTWPTPAPTATATPSPAPTATPAAATPTATPKPLSGYVVRRRGPGGTTTLLTEKPIVGPPFLDDTAMPAGRWCYSVRRVVTWDPLLTSAESPEGCVDLKEARPAAAKPGP